MNRINDFWKPFYFRWVETFLDKRCGEELVPLKHFLHRFTRSIFWEIEDMIPLFVPPPLCPSFSSSHTPPSAAQPLCCDALRTSAAARACCAWTLRARWVAARITPSIAASGGGWGRQRWDC